MYTLEQSLLDHPLALLRVIAELRGIPLHGHTQREVALELAAALATPEAIAQALAELSPAATEALEALAASQGRIQATLFQERYGEIRPFGPGRLTRERPWESPTGPAEELWYRGWIFQGFAEIDGTATAFIYVPDEVLALLPRPAQEEPRLPAVTAPATPIAHGDALVQDMVTFLAMIQMREFQRPRGRWSPAELNALAERWMVPEPPPLSPEGGSRLALLIHLAERMHWLQEDAQRHLQLRASTVRSWLQSDHATEWLTLWLRWRDDETWDDLRRLPGLVCEGGWHDDPVDARRRLFSWLARLQPGIWHDLDDWVSTMKRIAPEFLRPDGDYDSWYIRKADENVYLRGFAHWDEVEGQLIRYLMRGPLLWFGVVAMDERQTRFALTEAGRALLQEEKPTVAPAGRIEVTRDFLVLVPPGVASLDRFRVARFTRWEGSPQVGTDEPFRYRITQTALRRAEAQGITVHRILAFLREQTGDTLPENVVRALTRWPHRAR